MTDSSGKSPYVFHADSPRAVPVSTLRDANKLCKTPEFSKGRFIMSGTQEEANDYLNRSRSKLVHAFPDMEIGASDGYKSPFPRVPTENVNNLLRALHAKDFYGCVHLMEENPNYVIDMSADKPRTMQRGMMTNIIHILAKSGFVQFLEYVLEKVTDVDYLVGIYEFADHGSMKRASINLLDGFINQTDKMGNGAAKIAAKSGHYSIAAYLTCFKNFKYWPLDMVGLRRTDFPSDLAYKRNLDLFRKPDEVFCVSLYVSESDSLPFLVVTRKYPERDNHCKPIKFVYKYNINKELKKVAISSDVETGDQSTVFEKTDLFKLFVVIGAFSELEEAAAIWKLMNTYLKAYDIYDKNYTQSIDQREAYYMNCASQIAKQFSCYAYPAVTRTSIDDVIVKLANVQIHDVVMHLEDVPAFPPPHFYDLLNISQPSDSLFQTAPQSPASSDDEYADAEN